ncbi:hypothetical protein [Kribbella sp. C-35]|uniref:Mom family adenine methylcarbamoylation protein n=1 Tax=Kribbella sp. C-35 TaxID=2789276 RepID=UPI00397E4FA8
MLLAGQRPGKNGRQRSLSGANTGPTDDLSVRLTLGACRRRESALMDVVAGVAKTRNVDARELAVRTLLHLPRVARRDGTVGRRLALAEISRGVRHLSADIAAIRALVPTRVVDDVSDLRFQVYDDDKAFLVLTHMHYLRSARPDSTNFALVDRRSRLPVALCSATQLDWQRVGDRLGRLYGVPFERMWDISRVYSFDVAPHNAISMLLGHVRRWFRENRRDAGLLMTTVDPNMGFTGVSYRAANWQRWMQVRPRPFIYVNRQYTSPRQLRARFGTANLDEVRAQPGVTVQVSSTPLLNSSIYCCRLRGGTERIPEDRLPVVRR